ncbi:MAG: hypothetical protein V1652_04375 [bacterium]
MYFFIQSSFIHVAAFTVEGSKLFAEDVVREQVGGILRNKNIFARILGDENILSWRNSTVTDIPAIFSPNIAEIDIERNLFQRTVLVVLREREKKAVWCIAKDGEEQCMWVSEEGWLLGSAPFFEGRVIPIVHERSYRDVVKGEAVISPQEMKNFLHAFQLLEEVGVTPISIIVENMRFKEFEIETGEGQKFYFSFLFDPLYTESVVRSLEDSEEWKTIDYVDLRVENKVYYK